LTVHGFYGTQPEDSGRKARHGFEGCRVRIVSARARSFGSAAEAYVRGRPGYPEQAVRFVLPRVPCSAVDVGAGTGKLTEVLVSLGCAVAAVEPDGEIRARIVGAEARAGVAEELPLADCSVDAVVAGQAFHWFETAPFLDEAVRVLRPGGTVGLLRNEQDDRVGWVAELADLTKPGAFASADVATPFSDERFQSGELLTVPHMQPMDVPTLLDRVASSSRTIVQPLEQRAALLARVERFAHERFGESGFEFPYLTRAWRYKRRAESPGRPCFGQ
jgi:SAM-dependent methyltransferase